ncbi:hypothetical protein [Sulfurimonas sp.]
MATKEEFQIFFNIDENTLNSLFENNGLEAKNINGIEKYDIRKVLSLLKKIEEKNREVVLQRKKALLDFKRERRRRVERKWKRFEKEEELAQKQGVNTRSKSKLRFFHKDIKALYKKGCNINEIQNNINSKLPLSLHLTYSSYLAYIKAYIEENDHE